jgi:hypothetical protein
VNGNVLIGDGYTSNFLQITPSGTDTVLASGAGASNAALDSYGNVYFGGNYNANVYKLPYNAATGQYVGWTTAPTTTCLGGNQDTAPCLFAPAVSAYMSGTLSGSGASGYAGVAFDPQGNFFFESNTLPGTNPNSIFECNVACIASSSATPKLIYADTQPVGAFAIDPWGNIFFVDGKGNSKGDATNLNEIPLTSGSYASSPTVVESYTNAAGYGNGISGLAISGTGTLFFSVNADGIFAVPNTQSGGPVASGIYMLATQGGKGVALDSAGNLYGIPYNGGDVVSFIPVGIVPLGAEPVGTAATAVSATVIDNAASCTPTLALSVTESGASTSEFTAAAGATCAAAFSGSSGTFASGPLTAAAFSSFSVTANFTPTAAGERTAALIIKDSANSASGMVALTGVGQGAMANLDPGVSTAFSTGFTSPASIVADPAGDVFIADSGAGKVYEVANGTTTLTPIGSGFVNPDALAFDANGDLFIGDDGVPEVEEIVNTGTTGAFAAGTQSTAVSSTTVFGGMALSSATGLAVGPNGALYISDTANGRVVFWNPITGQAGVTLATSANGLKSPMGLAVDSSNNLYVADSGLNEVVEFSPSTGMSTISPPNVSQAVGVAVDGSGSVLVADGLTGNIVRIPNESGTLTLTDAITVEMVSPAASSLWLDSMGDAYVASTSGKAAYAIQRTAASLNLGTVSNGLTNSQTVYLENAGNATATLGTPSVTEPTNTMFTLVPGTTNPCSSGSSGPAGYSCQLTATFAPPVGTSNGVQSGQATVNIATPTVALAVNMTGTATQSSIIAQTITGFNPPTTLEAGQQTTLSATGGASGNPVVFSIDAASPCATCATVNGNILTAVSAGTVKVDANQAGGTANGKQYAAAPQVQAIVTVNYTVVPSDVPALLMNQIIWSYQSGAFTDGQNPAGGSFAVTQNGLIVVGTSYNNKADFVSASTGALVNQVTINGAGGFTIDSNNNLYMSHLYGPSVLKIPYVNGAYATLSDTSPANCTGTDTTLCTFASAPSGGVKAIAFDPSGNFYMVAVPGSTGSSAIYECAASCQTGGTATLLYSDANAVSQIAFDPWGNMFFTEGVYTSSGNFSNIEASTSNLNELTYTAGTGFATTPVTLQTLTDAGGNLHGYDNQLDGVAVTSNGTVYYATQNEGTFAVPNTQSGGPDTAHQYVVSNLGAKGMELDANGNEWVVVYYSGGDNIGEAQISDLTTPNAQYDGAAVTASANVVDNAFGCGTTPTLVIASSNPEFSATANSSSSSCSSVAPDFSTAVTGSIYPATITFTATKPNSQNATLSISDTANGGEGTATVTGFALTTPQALTFTAPAITTSTYAPGETITVSVTNGGSNNPAAFNVDTTSSGTGMFSATTVTGTTSTAVLTVTQAGSIVVDANEAGGLASGTYYDAAPQVQLTLTINQAAQAIVFPQPLSPVTYATNPSTTVTLSANGGASGNPVAFTVDPTSTGAGNISASTLSNGTSTATLTVTQAGNIVVDANQLANNDYAAATEVQQTIVVNQATQSIAFTPLSQPFYYIVTGATLSIQATGGGSDNAIVFNLDPKSTMKGSFSTSTVSGAVSTSIMTMSAKQSPTSGTIIVDANETGNTNYLAATQTQFTINVGAPLPTQTITLAVPQTQTGATTLTLTGTATSGFPVVYTSSTPLVCTVSGATVTFASVTSPSTCTITATQPGDNQYWAAAPPITVSFTVNPPGLVAAMNLSLSLSSLTLEPGTIGLTQVSITSQNNFTGSVSFACSGLPTGYSCTFNPNPITVSEGGTTTTALSISAPASAALQRDSSPLFPAATLAVAFCLIGFKKRNRLQLLLLFVVSFAALGLFTACGGSSNSNTTKSTTTTATVTATSGTMTQSATLTITVD